MKSPLGGIALFAVTILCSPGALAQSDDAGTFPYQGVDRHYVLHKGAHQVAPAPMVIALHGLNEPIDALRGSWTMDTVADRQGFDVLYPEALAGRWAYADSRPVTLPSGGLVNDIGFITSLLDKLVAEHTVDAAHVYVAGASNGGLMAWTLACGVSDRIAAAAPMISGMIERQVDQCHPQRLVPLVVIAGTDDWMQAYDGAMAPTFRLLSVPETLEYWRRLRGCQSWNVSELPPHEPTDPTAAVLVEWTECKDPSPQRFYRIEGGGHSLPSFAPLSDREKRPHAGRSQTIETAEELWSFFRTSVP